MEKVRARVIVSGIVQGVFFRASATDTARNNNVCGWVRNKPDGTVEAVLEGDRKDVAAVIEWCRTGPPAASVDGVQVEWEEFKCEFDDFNPLTRHNSY